MKQAILILDLWISLAMSALVLAESEPPEVSPGDAKSLLDAGIRSEEKGELAWAERAYRQILKVKESPEYAEAAFRLAGLEIRRKNFERGYAMLRELANKHGHAGARALLEKAENERTREQRRLLEKADASFKVGKFEEAKKQYTQAYSLAPEKPAAADFVPRAEILPKIAGCVDAIDDENYRLKAQPLARSILPCVYCKNGSGFDLCGPCAGKGIIERRVATIVGGGYKIRRDPCGNCAQIGWLFCKHCLGLEHSTELDKLTPLERKALTDIINRARALKILKMPVDDALQAVEEVLLRADQSAALSFFRAIKPKYTLCPELKAVFSSVPPNAASLKALVGPWAAAAKGVRTRASFLMGYTCEYAAYISQFDMLRQSQKKVDFNQPPSASMHLPGEPVGPEVLSAFPDDGTAGWVAVKATFEKYSEEDRDFSKGILALRGRSPHNVRFFVWRPEAKAHLARLEKSPWSTRVAGLAKSYPFTLRDKAASAPLERKVTVVGRFLRDRLGFPRNWFEVWDFKVGLTQPQEAMLEALVEPIEVSFPGVEARKLASFLHVWFGVRVRFDGVDPKTRVSCAARACPVGLFVDEVARQLGWKWQYRDGEVLFSRSVSPAAARDVEAVIGELRGSASADSSVTVSRGGAVVAAGAEPEKGSGSIPGAGANLPADPVALQGLLEKSSREMRYDIAAQCCSSLISKASQGLERERLNRSWETLRLYHAITKDVPVSHLAGARDIARIDVRNPAGDRFSQAVRILKREADYLVIQPSYGGEARIRADWIRNEEPIAAQAWKSRKKAEIDEGLAEAREAAPRERVTKLFLLALAAKTYDFSELGTGFLDEAAADGEFEWLLGTYFPSRSGDLITSWRKATGRSAPPAAAAPAPELPALPATGPRPDEPLPAAAKDLLTYARRHLAEGKTLLSRALPGMEDASRNRKLARDHFQSARKALDKVLEEKPQDADAIRMSRDVVLLIQTCVKDLGFFD